MKVKNMTVAVALSLAAVATPAGVAGAAVPHAGLPCSASMSNAHPKDYTTTDVKVTTAASAAVKTVAHYKSKNTTHTGTANSSGKATIPYDISGASKGYKVTVNVTVSKGSKTGSCSTSFTPS